MCNPQSMREWRDGWRQQVASRLWGLWVCILGGAGFEARDCCNASGNIPSLISPCPVKVATQCLQFYSLSSCTWSRACNGVSPCCCCCCTPATTAAVFCCCCCCLVSLCLSLSDHHCQGEAVPQGAAGLCHQRKAGAHGAGHTAGRPWSHFQQRVTPLAEVTLSAEGRTGCEQRQQESLSTQEIA